jgi:hypothetical protein
MRTRAVLATLLGLALLAVDASAIAPAAGVCTGDCDGDRRVTVDELMTGIGLALGGVGAAPCAAAFCQADCGPGPGPGRVEVSCLVAAVRRALAGCPLEPCRADAECGDGNGCTADRCSDGDCVSSCLCL